MNYNDDYLKVLQDTFLEEAKDLVEETEQLFLSLRSNPKNPSILQEIFQIYHTLKGSAGASGFSNLQAFVHKVESLISLLSPEDLSGDIHKVDLLIKCNDKISDFLDDVHSDRNANIDSEKLLKAIEIILNPEPVEESTSSAPYTVWIKDISMTKEKLTENSSSQEKDHQEESEKPHESPTSEKNDRQVTNESEQGSQVNLVKKADNNEEMLKSTVKPRSDEFIKMPLSKIQNLIDQFGELVILQSILEQHKNKLDENQELVSKTITSLAKITRETQKITMSLRMFPIKPLFMRLQKIVRDTSDELEKDISVKTEGENVELEKSVYDALAPAVGHIIRNSVDHGIEAAEDRAQTNKPVQATIKIVASQENGYFVLKISDDGQGLNTDKILQKAIEKDLISREDRLSEYQIHQLIFENGLSTSDGITKLSGRGVGMGAVNDAIAALKGSCEIDSVRGKGSRITIKVPLNLSVFNGTVVRVGQEKYVLPNSDFVETVKISKNEITHHNKVVIKGETFDVSYLGEHLPNFYKHDQQRKKVNDYQEPENVTAVVISNSHQKNKAFIVDELVSQERIVLKKLGDEISSINEFSGATIMSDGDVTLILNVNYMIS
ncbi:MAG: chemotaxis protein CheA [Oligoflexales bacterium]